MMKQSTKALNTHHTIQYLSQNGVHSMKLYTTLLALVLIVILTAGCGFISSTFDSYEEGEKKLVTETKPVETVKTAAPATITRACDDGIDEGNNPYVKSTVSVTYQGETTAYTDQCIDDYLKEYYCDANEYRSYKKLCAYGCEDGACHQSEKVDEPTKQISHETDRPMEDEDVQTSVVHCTNGYKDGDETDVDCGGSCKNCGYAKMCKVTEDCMAPYFCNYRQKICSETKS